MAVMHSGLMTLNLHVLYEEGLGEPLIRAFKKKLAEADQYDYVLVDSRTGFSDEAGICTRDLADHLMILSGLNRQNVEGTCEFLKALRVATDGKKSFQIILSPVPNGEDALVDQREAVAKAAFEAGVGIRSRSVAADSLPSATRAHRGTAHLQASPGILVRGLSRYRATYAHSAGP